MSKDETTSNARNPKHRLKRLATAFFVGSGRQFTPSPPEARRRRGVGRGGRADEFAPLPAPLPVRASRREGTRAPSRIWTASSPFQNVLFAACGHAAYNNPSGIHVRCRPGALAGRLFQRAARHFCPETPK